MAYGIVLRLSHTGANFKVTFRATNTSGGNVGCKLFWVCI
jgi:hypothetical protein